MVPLVVVAWAIAATWFAVSDQREIRRLADEAEIQRAAHDDKVRALTRRLVGVASHGMLEQEGLAGRLADIITRQVALENRQAELAAMAERAIAGIPVASGPTATPAGDPGLLGKDAAGSESKRGRGTLLEQNLAVPPERAAALPVREQFDRIETALTRTDVSQRRTLDRLTVVARNGIDQVRMMLAGLHLAIAPTPLPPVPAQAVAQDGFTARLAEAEGAFTVASRWRAVAESVPLRAPIVGDDNLTSNFGPRKDPFTGAARMHAGMDFRSPVGTPVRTAAAGRVVVAGPTGGYGNLVEIEHGNGLTTRYGHLSAINVTVDQPVAAGTIVGLVGSTGRSTGPHLHYETRLAGNALDPAHFLAAGQTLFGRPHPAQEPQAVAPIEASAEASDD